MEGKMEVRSLTGRINKIPETDATLTKAGHAADAKATGDALTARIRFADIADNLNSEAPNKPLSARMGNEIKKQMQDMMLSSAGTTGYDNATSGLAATNMQSAIDEVVKKTDEKIPNTGGTVKGPIKLQEGNVSEEFGLIKKDNLYYRTQLIDTTDNGAVTASIEVSAHSDSAEFKDRENTRHAIFTQKNKPCATYNGNGTAGTRELGISKFGNLLMVYSTKGVAIATPKGAFIVNNTGNTRWLDESKVSYKEGVLTMETADEMLNEYGVTYNYQAI